MAAIRTIEDLTSDNSANVLIVDDDIRVRELVKQWLTTEGHSCAQAASAQAAWEYLQAHEVDLVTLDIQMSGRSGISLLHQITAAHLDTSVIMLTGAGEARMAIDALTFGACAYLVKPVVREEFVFHVRRALEQRRLVFEKRDYTRKLEERVLAQTVVIRHAHEETIHRLISASLWRDQETGMHIKRTGLLSELLARAAGWSVSEAAEIRLAAPMHDVGKIGVPDAVLRKPGKLTTHEFEIMKQHTVIGAKMLADSNVPMLQMAQEIALNHHERWDGTGYPAGIAGHSIPESARIVAIVDAYDALTHDRVYRPALPESEVMDIMEQGTGTHFDPLLMTLFFSRLDKISQLARENPDVAMEPNDLVLSPILARAQLCNINSYPTNG